MTFLVDSVACERPRRKMAMPIRYPSHAVSRSNSCSGWHPFVLAIEDHWRAGPLMRARRYGPLKDRRLNDSVFAYPIFIASRYSDAKFQNSQRPTERTGRRIHVLACRKANGQRPICIHTQQSGVARIFNLPREDGSAARHNGVSIKNHFSVSVHYQKQIYMTTKGDGPYREYKTLVADMERENKR
jgi:hypothetical protein